MMRWRAIAALVALLALARCASAPEEHAQHAEKTPAVDRGHAAHEPGTSMPPLGEAAALPPGMAAVDVGSGRVQALGVRTAAVERRALVRKITAVAVVAPDERLVRKIQTRVDARTNLQGGARAKGKLAFPRQEAR